MSFAKFGVMKKNAWPVIEKEKTLKQIASESKVDGTGLRALPRLASLVAEVRRYLPLGTIATVYWCETSQKPCIFFELPGPLWETQAVVCPLGEHAECCSEQSASDELWRYIASWWERERRGKVDS